MIATIIATILINAERIPKAIPIVLGCETMKRKTRVSYIS
jgi:hypothetical protein